MQPIWVRNHHWMSTHKEKGNMKTVEIKFVVEDENADLVNIEIQKALENTALGDFSIFNWSERSSTKAEIKWKQKEDEQRD